jgi:uncharacterized protein YgfB (UPF0149 family)
MDELKEEIAALNEEIAELHGLVAGLASDLSATQFAFINGLTALREVFPEQVNPIITMMRDDLMEQGRKLQRPEDDDDDEIDEADAYFELSARLHFVNNKPIR